MKDEVLQNYQQSIANELFIMAHTGNRTETRIEIEKILRSQIAKEIENYRVAWCRCEHDLLPLCQHLLSLQEIIVPTDK